jgi:hypothetical protein
MADLGIISDDVSARREVADRMAEVANHTHSMWRDPSSDFGLDVLGRLRGAPRLIRP